VHAEVRDDRWRVVLHEVRELVAVAGIDAAELGAPETAAGRHEVDTHDVVGPIALLDQLRDTSSQLAAHSSYENSFAHSATTSGARTPVHPTSQSAPPVCAWPTHLLLLRSHVWEQDHFSDGRYSREHHHQSVDADTKTARWRQAVLERAHVVGVDVVGFCIP